MFTFGKPIVQTSKRQKEDIVPELKPSMARAPRMKKKEDILKAPRALAGIHYEVYKPEKHNT